MGLDQYIDEVKINNEVWTKNDLNSKVKISKEEYIYDAIDILGLENFKKELIKPIEDDIKKLKEYKEELLKSETIRTDCLEREIDLEEYFRGLDLDIEIMGETKESVKTVETNTEMYDILLSENGVSEYLLYDISGYEIDKYLRYNKSNKEVLTFRKDYDLNEFMAEALGVEYIENVTDYVLGKEVVKKLIKYLESRIEEYKESMKNSKNQNEKHYIESEVRYLKETINTLQTLNFEDDTSIFTYSIWY